MVNKLEINIDYNIRLCLILKASHLWDASRILVKFKNKYFINYVEEEEEEEFIRLHKSYRIHNSGYNNDQLTV